MFVANFLNMAKEPVNVKITFGEFLQSKISRKTFLDSLSDKFQRPFATEFYYKGTTYVR